MAGNIFINYRREDTQDFADSLYVRLEKAFPREKIFMDVDNIPLGRDFVEVLDEQVSRCEVLLVVIGKNWFGKKEKTDLPSRLHDPKDFVRLEISAALARNILVIPILVHGAEMPKESQLPEDLKSLARRHAIRISHEGRGSDIGRLVTELKSILGDDQSARKAQKPNSHLIKLGAVALLALAAGGWFLYGYQKGQENSVSNNEQEKHKSQAGYKDIKTVPNSDVLSLHVSKDQKYFGLMGYYAQIWESKTGRMVREIPRTHKNLPGDIVFSPDFSTIVTTGCNIYSNSKSRCIEGEAKIREWKSLKLLRSIKIHKKNAYALAMAVDGKSFFTAGCEDYNDEKNTCDLFYLKQWDINSGQLIQQIKLNNIIYSIAVHPKGDIIYLGGLASQIEIVNIRRGTVQAKFSGFKGSIYSLALSQDGKILAAGGGDDKVMIWNEKYADPEMTLSGHKDDVISVDISPDGQKVVSASRDRTVRVWDLSSKTLIDTFENFDNNTLHAAFISDDKKFVSVEQFKDFTIWQKTTGEE